MNREGITFCGGCLFGGLAGIALGVGIAAAVYGGEIQTAQLFPQKEPPAVMRIYNSGIDHILVEAGKNSDGTAIYIPLERHLNLFAPYSNRIKEENRIKELVGWEQ